MFDFLLKLDAGLLLLIQQMRVPLLDTLLSFYTGLGNGGFLWIAVSLFMLAFKRTRKAGILSLAALLVGALITNVTLKPLIDRARPWLVVEGLAPLIAEEDPFSFPSGHTCAAFSAAGIWWRTQPRPWGAAVLVLAALMGFSRLYVGVHFPSDVLAGICVGLVSSWLVWKALERAKKG